MAISLLNSDHELFKNIYYSRRLYGYVPNSLSAGDGSGLAITPSHLKI